MKNELKDRSEVMELAHAMTATGYTLAEGQRIAWKVEQAKAKMMKNLVILRFRRKDGVVVSKLATLNPAFLPSGRLKIKRRSTPRQVVFWSVNDNGYRSFIADRLVSVDDMTSIQQLIQQQLEIAA
jgi:hypothetical protein